MKFAHNLNRAELSFNDIVGLDLRWVQYKSLKKLLKRSLGYYSSWQELYKLYDGINSVELEHKRELYLETAEKVSNPGA